MPQRPSVGGLGVEADPGVTARHDWSVSFDVYAFVPPPGVSQIEDMPNDYEPASLGRRDAVVEVIRQVAPDMDSSDPSLLVLDGPDHLIEIGLGANAEVDGMMFFCRGGDGTVPLVLAICARFGAVAFDTSEGILLSELSGADSMATWQSYRDRVVRPSTE